MSNNAVRILLKCVFIFAWCCAALGWAMEIWPQPKTLTGGQSVWVLLSLAGLMWCGGYIIGGIIGPSTNGQTAEGGK